MKTVLLPLCLMIALPNCVFGQRGDKPRADVKPAAKAAAKSKTAQTAAAYYLEIDRPDCCRLEAKAWQQIAEKLQTENIPAFFGSFTVLDYQESWHPSELQKTMSDEGLLILGAFASEELAEKALARLPKLLPKNGDEFRGIEAGTTAEAQTWRVGMYQIRGLKATSPAAAPKPENPKAGTIEGVVVEVAGGASWFGIVVESQGLKYLIQLGGNSGGVKSVVGDVETVGNRVRITYRNLRTEQDGSFFLDATRVEQIK